jgi:hypothetical protein
MTDSIRRFVANGDGTSGLSMVFSGIAALVIGFAAPAGAQSPEPAGFAGETVMVGRPAPGHPSAAGADTLHDTVRALIRAVSANRADEAFAVAAPSVRASLGDPKLFLAMIARFQAPLYSARRFQFDGIDRTGKSPVVRAYLDAGNNRRWLGRFTMERQAGGAWKILDVALTRAPGHVI